VPYLEALAPGQGGNPTVFNDAGLQIRGFGRSTIVVTDADLTPTAAQLDADIIELITGVYTAGRNVFLPLVSGLQFTVFNNQGGAFAATFKGASGTGIAVAQGKRAIIYCDGTNWVRVTADT
jgi:hypothetical protein